MNRKIRVLQLVEGLSLGGAETKLLELIDHMDKSRFETTVCSLGLGNNKLLHRVKELDVDFLQMERKNRFDVTLPFRLAKLAKEKQIDVIMTTLFYADFMGALAGKIAGTKAVFSWETISAPEWLYPRRLYPYRFAIRYCTNVISVSKATARWLSDERGVAPDKVIVIPYGVDIDKFSPGKNLELKRSLGLADDAPVVGTVARLHPQKGHKYLIEAAPEIIRNVPNVKFVFAGDGETRTELEQMVQQKGIAEHFMFLGFRSDVHELLNVFDMFVLPSLYEGLPNVILEAMATGLPVVACAVDGTPELVVDGETGYLAEPRVPEQLAVKISDIMSKPERAKSFGEAGRLRAEEHFSLTKEVNEFQTLYEKFALNGVH